MPGTLVYDQILHWFPGGPKTFLSLVKHLTIPMVGIHITEAYMLDRKRLRKYGVKRGSGLWWTWITSCFVEGFACFQRIDAQVKRKELEKEKEKH